MKQLIKFLILVVFATPLSAQSLLEELPSDTDIILRDLGSTNPVPVYVEETPPPLSDVADKAKLRGLDRLNGTVEDIEIAVGDTVRFARLEITLEQCRYPQGDIAKDAYAMVTIRDVREFNPRFHGWMFASSPALSALDHPRYDVWVLSCQSS